MGLLKKYFGSEDNEKINEPSFLQHEEVGESIRKLIAQSNLSDESLVKVTRQLEFWYDHGNLTSDILLELSTRLVNAAEMPFRDEINSKTFKVPTRRFGRTEIQMPIVTMGGMRVQQTVSRMVLLFSKFELLYKLYCILLIA